MFAYSNVTVPECLHPDFSYLRQKRTDDIVPVSQKFWVGIPRGMIEGLEYGTMLINSGTRDWRENKHEVRK